MVYHGSCHCGAVAFEVEGELEQVTECNCSICRRKGSLLWFVPRSQLRLLTPEENLATYTFNTQMIHHRFCPKCGIHPFAESTDRDGNPMAAINVRCLDEVDPATLEARQFDGRSL